MPDELYGESVVKRLMEPDQINAIALRLLCEQEDDRVERHASSQISMRKLIAFSSVVTDKVALDLQQRRLF